jgi:hypothetical protein
VVSKSGGLRYRFRMRDPGLDKHEWETEWQALQEALEDSPREALAEVGDLVERIIRERGIPIDDEVADDGVEVEISRDFQEARRITDAVERGDEIDPGDIGSAVRLYRELYESLTSGAIDL